MNPYPKGLGGAMAPTAPTSAGKVGTHFNSPYMKSISQNLMTAIYGSPQDDLTRQRIAQSKLMMETQQGKNDAAEAETARLAGLSEALASNNVEGYKALAKPEEMIKMFGEGSYGGGRGGSGRGGRGGAGGIGALEIGRFQERAGEILGQLIDEDELKALPYNIRAQMTNDLVSQLADGNQLPSLPGFTPRSSSGWTDIGNNNVPATYQPMYSGDYLANSESNRFISNWERITGGGFSGVGPNGQPVLGSNPQGGGGSIGSLYNTPAGGGNQNQAGGGGGNPLTETYSAPGGVSSTLLKLATDIPSGIINGYKDVGRNIADTVSNAAGEMREVGWDGAVDIAYDGIGGFFNNMKDTAQGNIDGLGNLLSQGQEAIAPYLDQAGGYATQADNYLTNTAGPAVRDLLQSASTPGSELVEPYIQKADQYLSEDLGPRIRSVLDDGAQAVGEFADFATPHIVNGVKNSPYGHAAGNAMDTIGNIFNDTTAQLNRPNYSLLTGPNGGESKIGNIFGDAVEAGSNAVDRVGQLASDADTYLSETAGPAVAKVLQAATKPGHEMLEPYAQQADQFLSETAGPAVRAGLDTVGNVAGQAGDMISAGYDALDTRQALKDTPDAIVSAITDGYEKLEPVYDATTGAIKWAAVNSPVGRLIQEYPAYAAQAQKERTFQLQAQFSQQNPGQRPPVEYMYPVKKGATAADLKKMGIPNGAFVLIDRQPMRIDY
jgi:hypothetical protein